MVPQVCREPETVAPNCSLPSGLAFYWFHHLKHKKKPIMKCNKSCSPSLWGGRAGRWSAFTFFLKEAGLSNFEKNLVLKSSCLSNTQLWTDHAGWFLFPLYPCIFEVCSASSEFIFWKLLSLASELNNLKVKRSGPNWLILFSFFHQMTHNTMIWSDKIQFSPCLS